MRILLIEDHDRLASFVRKGLGKEGFTVDLFGTLAEGMAVTYRWIEKELLNLEKGEPSDAVSASVAGRPRGATPH